MSNIFRETFANDVTEFIYAVQDSSEISTFLSAIVGFLIVLTLTKEITLYMMEGFDFISITQSIMMIFVGLGLMGFYVVAFDAIHHAFDELGLLILSAATGNRDPFFLSKWVVKSLTMTYAEDGSLWSLPWGQLFYMGLWMLLSLLIQAYMYAVAAWGVWTIALSKLIGPFFIPFIIFSGTKETFDAWFRFTYANLLLLIILRATGAITALTIKAYFTSLGIMSCGHALYFSTCNYQHQTIDHMNGDWIDLVVVFVISLLFIGSSIAFTKELAAGVASPSRAASQGTQKMAQKMAKFNPLKEPETTLKPSSNIPQLPK